MIAVAVIVVLLALVLRRARDVALVVAPLLLAALLTLGATVIIGMKLNYANIIALPLLLGIGVAFDIYFVMNWRAGLSDHGSNRRPRARVQRADDNVRFWQPGAVARPGLGGYGQVVDAVAGDDRAVHAVYPAGAAGTGSDAATGASAR